jgi:hypothetical protein
MGAGLNCLTAGRAGAQQSTVPAAQAPWPAARSAAPDNEIDTTKIPTRFGIVTLTTNRDDRTGRVEFKKDRVDTEGSFQALEGVYRLRKGDVVVVRTGAEGNGVGLKTGYYVLLVAADRLVEIPTGEGFYTLEDPLKVRQRGDDLYFDLGYEEQKRKTAILRNGAITMHKGPAEQVLATADCIDILKDLAECKKMSTCTKYDTELGNTGERHLLFGLAQKSPFKVDSFMSVCYRACKTGSYDEAAAQRLFCGYDSSTLRSDFYK